MRFAEENPKNPWADNALARTALIYGDELFEYERALFYYRKLREKYPQSSLFFWAKRKEETIERLLNLVRECKEKSTFLSWVKMAKAYALYGDFKRAVKTYEETIEKFPFPPELPLAYYEKGYWLINLGNYPRAREALKIVVEKYPDFRLAPDADWLIGASWELEAVEKKP